MPNQNKNQEWEKKFNDFYANKILPRISGDIVGIGDEFKDFVRSLLSDLRTQHEAELVRARKDCGLIRIGWHKNEMDFSVATGEIGLLNQEQMEDLRVMTMVAIGIAETARRREGNETTNIKALTKK